MLPPLLYAVHKFIKTTPAGLYFLLVGIFYCPLVFTENQILFPCTICANCFRATRVFSQQHREGPEDYQDRQNPKRARVVLSTVRPGAEITLTPPALPAVFPRIRMTLGAESRRASPWRPPATARWRHIAGSRSIDAYVPLFTLRIPFVSIQHSSARTLRLAKCDAK